MDLQSRNVESNPNQKRKQWNRLMKVNQIGFQKFVLNRRTRINGRENLYIRGNVEKSEGQEFWAESSRPFEWRVCEAQSDSHSRPTSSTASILGTS